MISKKQVEQIMNALTLECWGIISMDETHKGALKRRATFNCVNSILDQENMGPFTIVAIGMPYDYLGMSKPKDELMGKVDAFAWDFDYHTEVKALLIKIRDALNQITPLSEAKVIYCVDNSPYNDCEVAFYAGLGQIGYNHLLMNDKFGTHFFIGYMVVYDALPFELDAVVKLDDLPLALEHPACSSCKRCISACPTGVCSNMQSIPDDMQYCLSSLTQTKEVIDEKWLPKFGNRIYGCNICQMVCPMNQFNKEKATIHLKSPNWLDPFELLGMSQKTFKEKYGQMGFAWRSLWIYKRNALITIGNSSEFELIKRLQEFSILAEDDKLSPYFHWAIRQLEGK